MHGRRTSRWLALGGLMLAFGCRSASKSPVITTPLFPDAVIPGPPPTPGVPGSPSVIPPSLSSKQPILPHGAQLPKLPEFEPRLDNLVVPGTTTAAAETRQPVIENALPQIKPLLVPPPGPAAGPDGFAPAPIIPIPEEPRKNDVPRIVNLPEQAPLPLKADEQFGKAADHRWVAGTLDYHAKAGYWTLRYADHASDDEWGGKVRLVDDARLRDFRAGDTVYIEGDLLAPRAAAQFEAASYPPYRIAAIRKIDR